MPKLNVILTKCFIIQLFLLCLSFAHGNPRESTTIHLDSLRKTELAQHLCFYDDTTNSLEFSDVVQKYRTGQFVCGNEIPDELVPFHNCWLHFRLSLPIEQNYPWMLYFKSIISGADVYEIKTYSDFRTDTICSHVESVNNYHKLKVILNPVAGRETDYFIRLYLFFPQSTSIDSAFLVPQTSFVSDYIIQSTFVGVLWGIMLLLLTYYIFKLIAWRKRIYFYYVMYIFFHLVFSFFGSHLLEDVIAPGHSFASYNWLYSSFSIGIFFYVLFIREFIQVKTVSRNLDYWFYRPYIWLLVVSNLCMVVAYFLNDLLFYQIYFVVPIVYGVLALVLVAILILNMNQPQTKIVLVGSLITIVTGVGSILVDSFTLLENNHLYNVGMVVDLLFYSFALNRKEKSELRLADDRAKDLIVASAQLSTQQRELTSKALYINRQDMLLQQLKERMQKTDRDTDDTMDDASAMLNTLELHMHQNSWDEFERYFIEVHPSFYIRLKDDFPALTQNELRLCALLRLNLNTKQISDITQKTAKSIDVTRSRIRQKINLSRDVSLFDFLVTI